MRQSERKCVCEREREQFTVGRNFIEIIALFVNSRLTKNIPGVSYNKTVSCNDCLTWDIDVYFIVIVTLVMYNLVTNSYGDCEICFNCSKWFTLLCKYMYSLKFNCSQTLRNVW